LHKRRINPPRNHHPLRRAVLTEEAAVGGDVVDAAVVAADANKR
jgi:hypothetical protein